MRTPKEDPEAVEDRERERRLADRERNRAAQRNAASLTSDLRGVYGIRRNFASIGTL